MSIHFDLVITADNQNQTAEFSLLDASGVQLAHKQTRFGDIAVSRQQGLFNLREYLRLYVVEEKEQAVVAQIGVCIAEEVLGSAIFSKLWESRAQRTLRIQLPGAGDSENQLVAALARVPWEIARPNAEAESLGERNVLVRVVHNMHAPASTPIVLAEGEALRVLFVFAESRGSRPLGARKERLALLRLFEKEIYPKRRIVAHFLTHGVTRERLEAQISENGGYHIVHWSGHGHQNLLELCRPGGEADYLSGEQLLDLFADAGGYLPRLLFLSACHSGDILQVKDWDDFLAVAQGKEPGAKKVETRDIALNIKPGYTGTAHALLQGGVPSVVAMRYAVGDDYARELAVEFYRALLAHAQPKSVSAALTMARQAVMDPKKHDSARFSICDHATPLLYGAEQPDLTLVSGRSPEHTTHNRRPNQIAELTMAEHRHFVGRTWELVGLGSDFIGSSTGTEVNPVAVITGLGGMGKTALVAEALALWETRFEWVLLYQAKPNRLEFEATLRDIHMKLKGEVKRYHDHVQTNAADAIYRDVDTSTGFTGPARLQRLTRNLLRALKDEPILLVLDNFETNLKPADPASPHSACQDAAWDDCLELLATGLAGSPSRLLITCRRPLAALKDGAVHSVPLGPLPSSEAALYLREQPTLAQMIFSSDKATAALAMRLLNASRFHPLLMDRLAKLAAHAPPRAQLMSALDALEQTKDFAKLPELFAKVPGDATELAYLDDALASSLDQLIRGVSPDARRLLWIIAMANQPEALGLVRGVWSGEDHEQEQLRQIKQMLDMLPQLPEELQAQLLAMPPEVRAMIDALPPEGPAKPDLAPLLTRLVGVGLVTEERDAPDDDNPNLICHELVRERIRAWMAQHPQDKAELNETVIRLAYAERLETVFDALQHQNMAAALGAGSRTLVYCVQAGAWDRLSGIASGLVTSSTDPHVLEALVPHLQTAAESAPEGRLRWTCLANLADALRLGGRPDVSVPLYEQAAAQAQVVTETGDGDTRQAWSDLGAITGNWANALSVVGNLDLARQKQIDSAEAERKAGNPAINWIGSELEALRIDILQGKVATALPAIEARLAEVQEWWQQNRSGQPVPEAPEAETLARALVSALDIARQAHVAEKDWPAALLRIDSIIEVELTLNRPAEEIASTRMNRANVLSKMQGGLSEVRAELEACLALFKNNPAASASVLSSLADLFDEQGDYSQAIIQQRRSLALREQLPRPADRVVSHHNLSIYLKRSGAPPAIAEAHRHEFAALVYGLVAALGQHFKTTLSTYVISFRRAQAAGTELTIPRVAELLADPAFSGLEQWLRQREVNLDELQSAVDHYLDQARQAAQSS